MHSRPETDDAHIEQTVREWLEQVVVGLGLCPFAAALDRERQVEIRVSHAHTESALLEDLHAACRNLGDTPAARTETAIVVVADLLMDFAEYNAFLDPVDALIERAGLEGVFQVASFHPDYQFAGTHPDDAENLTNRAPWPLLHILREDSVARALAAHPDPGGIPARNIRTVEALEPAERARRWPFLARRRSQS